MATRSRLLDALATALRQVPDWTPEEHLLVAVSGGPDSTALLAGLVRLTPRFAYRLTVAHVGHGLRGAESTRDATAAHDLAVGLGLSCRTLPAPIAPGPNLEARARQARYRALRSAAQEVGASRILTGHTRDDQVETMLLRLLRGSGRAGLAGIAAHRGRLLRPLLAATRTDVRRFLVEQGLTATLDRSNADLSHRRNRVRRLLVPLLESEFNPRLGQTLAATAERLRDEDVVLGEIAARCLAELGKDGALSTAVGAEPRAIVRRVVRAWLQPPAARALSAHDIERVVALATPGGPRRVDLARGDTILTDGIWLRVEPTVAVPRRR